MKKSDVQGFSILSWFFISTTFNHKMFFISVGSFSIRPYMLVMVYGFVRLVLAKHLIRLSKGQKHMLLFMWFFLVLAAVTGLYSPYVFSNPVMFFRNMILLSIQWGTFLFLLILFNHTDRETVAQNVRLALNLMLILAYLLYVYQILTKGFVVYNESYIGMRYSYQGRPRMMGTVSDPNYFALYISAYYWLYVYLEKGAIWQNRFLLVSFLGAVMLSQSRNAILTNVIILGGLFLVEINRRSFFKGILVVLGIVPFVFVLNRFILDGQQLLVLSGEASFDMRLRLLLEGFANIGRYPFGVGVGYMPDYYLQFTNRGSVAHNDFLSVFVELGLCGVILYLALFLVSFVNTNRRGRLLIMTVVGFSFGLTLYYFDPIIPIVFAALSAGIGGESCEHERRNLPVSPD